MSTRDELANLIDDAAEWATSQGRICSPHEVADAILAAGWIKPDREEWGVILDDYGSTDMFDSESEAREDQKRNGGTVARFTVTEYPQEVA